MRTTRLLAAAALLLPTGHSLAVTSAACGAAGSPVRVQITAAKVLRAAVPQAMFGFHVPWYDAQIGYLRKGEVRPEVVDWLKPFAGAVYRYPGASNTFDWRQAVGPVAQRRPIAELYAPQSQAVVTFGPDAFMRFLARVDGEPLWVLNLNGVQGRSYTTQELLHENLEFSRWIHAESERQCVGARRCQRKAYELGNELDWAPLEWTASRYVERAAPLLRALRKAQPDARLVVMGQTAPWDSKSQTRERTSFDRDVAGQLASLSDGVTLHPYYDGHSISYIEEYVDRLSRVYKAINPAQQIHITEHGRWPSQPLLGRWEDNWYQASGSAGGVSSADFVLAMLPRPGVASTMWHSMGVQGPWQLIKWDRRSDTLYPSPAYWALRVLREAMLEDVVAVEPAQLRGGRYAGGYELRLVAMRGAAGRLSLMGVNRSDRAFLLQPQTEGQTWRAERLQFRQLVADARGSDNTDDEKQRFTMQQWPGRIAAPDGTLCVAPQSVFSVSLE